jgi:hypothetical protein
MTKSSAKVVPKSRRKLRKTASKVAVKANRRVALETASDAQRKSERSLEEVGGSTLKETVRGVAARNVAQTRELYERSKSTIDAMLDSWQRSFEAAGRAAVALNRSVLGLTDRSVRNGFDLATALAGTKNFAEVMELQTAYWRKQLGDIGRLTNKTRS